jgi:hypothetical protein
MDIMTAITDTEDLTAMVTWITGIITGMHRPATPLTEALKDRYTTIRDTGAVQPIPKQPAGLPVRMLP